MTTTAIEVPLYRESYSRRSGSASIQAEPEGLMGALARAAGAVDLAFVRATHEVLDPEGYRTSELLRWIGAIRACEAHYAKVADDEFYAKPRPLGPIQEWIVRRLPDGRVSDLVWPSGYVPHHPEQRRFFAAYPENSAVHVRLFRHAHPAPTIICAHGYRCGEFRLEERIWPVSWLYGLGLDVALYTLPFHALRAPSSHSGPPPFPHNRQVARTNEALGQAVWDLRGLLGWLRRGGAPTVGIAGMSLGGYVAALLATVEHELDFVIPFVPAVDLVDNHVAQRALFGEEMPEEFLTAAKRALTIGRPLARRLLVPSHRVLVVAGQQDRVTGLAQAENLAAHFRSRLVVFPGAHVLQVGRKRALREMARLLAATAGVAQAVH